jgi:hypothetical protein
MFASVAAANAAATIIFVFLFFLNYLMAKTFSFFLYTINILNFTCNLFFHIPYIYTTDFPN